MIRKIDRNTADTVTTVVGTFGPGDDGNSTQATFNTPSGVALIGTDLYVSDMNNHIIRKVNLASGSPTTDAAFVVTVAGTSGVAGNDRRHRRGGAVLPALRHRGRSGRQPPAWSATSATTSSTRSCCPPARRTRRRRCRAARRSVASRTATGTAAQFNYPRGLAVASNGDSYVADSVNHLIRKVTSAGVVTTYAGTFAQAGGADGAARQSPRRSTTRRAWRWTAAASCTWRTVAAAASA